MTNCQLQAFGAGNADTEENQPGTRTEAKGTVSSPLATKDTKALVKRIISKIRALPGEGIKLKSRPSKVVIRVVLMLGQGTISVATVDYQIRSGCL